MRKLFLGLLLLSLACDDPLGLNTDDVTLSVSGSMDVADIIWSNDGGSHNLDDVELPWSVTFSPDPGDLVSVYAVSYEGGSITAKVKSGGSTKDSETGTGDTYCSAYAGWIVD